LRADRNNHGRSMGGNSGRRRLRRESRTRSGRGTLQEEDTRRSRRRRRGGEICKPQRCSENREPAAVSNPSPSETKHGTSSGTLQQKSNPVAQENRHMAARLRGKAKNERRRDCGRRHTGKLRCCSGKMKTEHGRRRASGEKPREAGAQHTGRKTQ
jgi:hypothetical protein